MSQYVRVRIAGLFILAMLLVFAISACNLTRSSPEESIDVTEVPTNTLVPSRTPASGAGVPTSAGVTPLPIPTQQAQFPTAVFPPAFYPSLTPTPSMPASVFILSPIPGNVVAGNVQVIGSAIHPDFLQYQLEYGPDPNPGNLWFPITGAVQSSVNNGLLGIWNTGVIQDSVYQLRLRVFLRNGTEWGNVAINNVRVQNQAPTPAPSNTPTVQRPIAAFTQDRTSGTAPLVVRFTDQSTGQITSRSWNFGDNSTGTELNPVHTFQNPGTYNVVLTVNGPGGSSNVTRQINVRDVSAPVAAFTQSTASGTAPLTVEFQDRSTGQIDRREWNFGDGTTSDATQPSHTFEDVGTYNVILTVFGPGGSSSVVRRITVENPQIPEPEASFVPDQPVEGDIPLRIDFENTSTGEITGFEWDFGDGITSSERDPSHTYTEPGNYEVVLRAFGPGGQSTANLNVEAVRPIDAPTASFDIEGDVTSGRAPLTITFNNTSEGQIDNLLWDFGDGQQSESRDEQIEHTYNEPGTFLVRLIIANEAGSDSAEATINVLTPLAPPQALFSVRPQSGPAPLEVEFTNQSSGDNLAFLWDFGTGDTNTNPGPNLTYTFATSGNYTVRLTATNQEDGRSDTFELPITVSDEAAIIDPLEASFIARPDPATPRAFILEAVASGGTGEYNFNWDFGADGVPDATGDTSAVSYPQPGTYTITLTVTDGENDPITVQQTVTTLNASFSAQSDPGNPLTVNLSATATGGSSAYEFTWDFGLPGTAPGSGQNTSITYPEAGTYTITLTVSDGIGAPVTVQQAIELAGPPPTATAEPTMTATPVRPVSGTFETQIDPNNPLRVDVVASAEGGVGNYEFTWNFGADGVPDATGQTASVTYPQGGSYIITLTINDGQTEPFVAQQQINAQGPPTATPEPTQISPIEASFNAAIDPNDLLRVNVEAFTSGGTGAYEYNWNFGAEGVPGASGQVASVTYPQAGTYVITLTVSDSQSEPFVTQQQINVQGPPTATPEPTQISPIEASFNAAIDPNDPLRVNVEAFASGGTGAYEYNWNFGAEGVPGASGQVASVAYPQAGTYTITLSVSDGQSEPFVTQQQVNVEGPQLEPLQASFIARPDQTTPRTFIFEATASGGTGAYEYNWNFGAEGVPNMMGPVTSATYPQAGTYTVTLTVNDGQSEPFVTQQQVTPLTATFTVDVDPNNPLRVTAQASATGGTGNYSYNWNFGAEGVPDDLGQTVSAIYPQGGTYTITLTVIDGVGAPVTAQQQITLEAPEVPTDPPPQQPTENLAASQPVMPDLFDLRSDIENVAQTAVDVREGNAFALVGDQMADRNDYLRPFGTDNYQIGDPSMNYLNDVIMHFDASGSFDRESVAVSAGMTVRDLLSPGNDPSCNPDESLLRCEMRLTNAAYVLIAIGQADILQMTDPAAFEEDLNRAVREVLNANALPILQTVYPLGDPGLEQQTIAINNAIINVANDRSDQNGRRVPLYNQWRSFTDLPQQGLANGEPSVHAQGAGFITPGANDGANVRNIDTLALLYDLWMEYGQ